METTAPNKKDTTIKTRRSQPKKKKLDGERKDP
jgi:hypothetical protein